MNRTKIAIAIALFLMFSMTFSLVPLPAANAHTPPWEISTYTYCSITPNPVGKGQQVVVGFWVDKQPPTAVGDFGDRWAFTIDVTKPDDSKETLGPIPSDPAGTSFTYYTPDQTGNYTFVVKMTEHTITGLPMLPGKDITTINGAAYVNDTFLESASAPYTLTVQEEPIPGWPSAPLPTEYWARPINAMNREWSQIAGNWLGGFTVESAGAARSPLYPDNRYNQYSTGPESAHIMWTRPIAEGGIVDGTFGAASYYGGLSYEQFWGARAGTPIVINGRIYSNVLTPPRYGYQCIDLRTGEEIWFHNSTGPLMPTAYKSGGYPELSFGQVLYFECPNQYGGFAYLWSAGGVGYYAPPFDTWMMFDAYTGNYICSIANISAGTIHYDTKHGDILKYNIDTKNGRLTIWNTTAAIMYRAKITGTEYWEWRPLLGYTFDGNHGYSLNVSIPQDVKGSILAILDDRIIVSDNLPAQTSTAFFGVPITGKPYTVWCLSLKDGEEGSLMWKKTYTPPSGNLTLAFGVASLEDGVFTVRSKETMQWWGYSLDDGSELWGPTDSQSNWMMFNMNGYVADGKLITSGGYSAGGEIHAYDIKTGEQLWAFYGGSSGFEGWYDNNPISVGAIADGKIYTFSSEHSASMPLRRDAEIRCLDLETGNELWHISHWGTDGPALADGYLVDLNHYDLQVYCYGKGPSSTTVAASPKVSANGDSILVEGTVTDISPGTDQFTQTARFPHGVPAIADENMSAWMEYLYMQQPKPQDATGVNVTISVFDPNNNVYDVGTTTSDASGNYKLMFTPPVPGEYTVIATFTGSKSYYGSTAETNIGVNPAPAATAPPTAPPASMADLYLVPGIVGIIIAIAIVGALILLSLRKR